MSAKSITVQGRTIRYEIIDIAISSLEYYRDNPRINYIISKHSVEMITQDFIYDELFKRDSTKELIRDLEANKGMLDEVYVLNNKVVEGNTRLCAFRYLNKKYPNDSKWNSIKCRVLQDDVSDEELFYILSTFHIKGKTEWDAFEKAAYIYKMIRMLNKSPEEIAKQLGMTKNTVEARLNAYEAMATKYLKKSSNSDLINGSRDELKKYSYFEAFYLQKDLVDKAEQTPAFLDDFVEWVREERLKKAQDVRELPKILRHKKARKEFTETVAEEAFVDAMNILHEHKPGEVQRFYKKLTEFRKLLEETEIITVKTEISENPHKKNELKQCLKDLQRFCKDAGLA
jgi:hypothetical protein